MFYKALNCLLPILTLTFSIYAIEQQSDILIYMTSQNDDPIGSNQIYVFDELAGHYEIHRIMPSVPNEVKGISITLYKGREEGWQFKFVIPVKMKLAVGGKYKSARSYPYQTADQAGMKVCKIDQDFKDLQGEFEVLEYTLNSESKIASLAIDFHQIAAHQGTLHGSIRYNSLVPLLAID